MKSITKRAKTSRPTPASKASLQNEPGSMCQTSSTICKFGLICVISVCSLTILWNEGSKHVSDLTAGTVKYTRHLFEISNAHRFHRKTQVAMNKNTRFRGTMNWSDVHCLSLSLSLLLSLFLSLLLSLLSPAPSPSPSPYTPSSCVSLFCAALSSKPFSMG